MPNFNVNVQSRSGANFADRDRVKKIINNNLNSCDARTVDVYPMDGEKPRAFGAGSESRFIIFINQAYAGGNEEKIVKEEPVIINNVIKFQEFLPVQGLATQIKAEDGTVIAEYEPRNNELYVLINLMTDGAEEDYLVFEYIVQQANELIFKQKHLRFSWKHSSDKSELTKGIEEQFMATIKQATERAKRQYDEAMESEQYQRQELKRALDRVKLRGTEYAIAQEKEASSSVSVDEQLDQIVQHPKVLDLHIKNRKYIVFTDEIFAYDKHDFRYRIGKMRIEFDPTQADVKFFGEHEPVGRGYWGSSDPHPHVSSSGTPCLGSVSEAVATLSHQMELYALTLTLIDYLENVNIDDPAGKYAQYYDRVDEEGNVTAKGGTYQLGAKQQVTEEIAVGNESQDGTRARCWNDGDVYDIEDMTYAYSDYDETGDGTNGHWVHEENVSDNHTWDERIGAYVYDDNYDADWVENNTEDNEEESDLEELEV